MFVDSFKLLKLLTCFGFSKFLFNMVANFLSKFLQDVKLLFHFRILNLNINFSTLFSKQEWKIEDHILLSFTHSLHY